MPTPRLSVVVPVFNEEASIAELVRRTVETCERLQGPFELILVDDGSTDDSVAAIEAAVEQYPGRVVGIVLSRNYGQHAAVLAGFERACGEMIVTLDADLQNPPEEIPRIVEAMKQGADVVGSIRTPRRDSLFRRAASAVINRMVRAGTGVDMHDYGSMLRGYRRHIARAMIDCQERSTFIPVLANTFARRTAEIEVRHEARTAGESRYSLGRLINLQFDLLTCMTTSPLRLLSVLGLMAALTGILIGVLLIVLRLLLGSEWAAQGVFTLLAALFVLIGAQFLALGLLGEYIGRIHQDVRRRPRYVVERLVTEVDSADDEPAPDPSRSIVEAFRGEKTSRQRVTT